MNNSVVVIGGGPAGMAAAGKLQEFGHDVVLIEKQAEVESSKGSLCWFSRSTGQ